MLGLFYYASTARSHVCLRFSSLSTQSMQVHVAGAARPCFRRLLRAESFILEEHWLQFGHKQASQRYVSLAWAVAGAKRDGSGVSGRTPQRLQGGFWQSRHLTCCFLPLAACFNTGWQYSVLTFSRPQRLQVYDLPVTLARALGSQLWHLAVASKPCSQRYCRFLASNSARG